MLSSSNSPANDCCTNTLVKRSAVLVLLCTYDKFTLLSAVAFRIHKVLKDKCLTFRTELRPWPILFAAVLSPNISAVGSFTNGKISARKFS